MIVCPQCKSLLAVVRKSPAKKYLWWLKNSIEVIWQNNAILLSESECYCGDCDSHLSVQYDEYGRPSLNLIND